MTATLEAASLLGNAWRHAHAATFRLGHAVGWRQGYAASEADAQAAWSALAATVREAANDPTRDELEQRRTPDFQPCAIDCGICSRCICAESYRRRGGRPFIGLRGTT